MIKCIFVKNVPLRELIKKHRTRKRVEIGSEQEKRLSTLDEIVKLVNVNEEKVEKSLKMTN